MIKIVTTARFKIDRNFLSRQVKAILTKYGLDALHFNIIFVGTRKMQQIAQTYKQEKIALPVLSFSYLNRSDTSLPKEEQTAGEIFICYPQAVLLAAERDRTVDAMMIELIEHGITTIVNS